MSKGNKSTADIIKQYKRNAKDAGLESFVDVCNQLLATMPREARLREAANLALSDLNDDAYYSAAERLEKALDDLQS